MKITIAQNIRRLRENAHLKQEELGNKLGVGGATISSWEKGRTEPNMGYTQALADFFKITTDELIYGEKGSLTEIPMDHVVFDDYFPLHYYSGLSAGSFEELLQAEPDSVVYVPIIFQSRRKRLHAFKVNGTSMNNVIDDGSIVIAEDTADGGMKIKDGTIVVAFLDGKATVKRFYYSEDHITLMPDSTDKAHMPITVTPDQQLYIIGRVIWHMNPDNIADLRY